MCQAVAIAVTFVCFDILFVFFLILVFVFRVAEFYSNEVS